MLVDLSFGILQRRCLGALARIAATIGPVTGARDGICACNSAKNWRVVIGGQLSTKCTFSGGRLEVTSLVRARLASLLDPEDLSVLVPKAKARFKSCAKLRLWNRAIGRT